MDSLEQARKNLETLTPLTKNCGLLCGQACCQPDETKENGMLLFPGEERYYTGQSWCRMKATGQGNLLICDGTCPRETRPLACRIFPLVPVVKEQGEVAIQMDPRARGTCPLVKYGIQGLHKDFVEAVHRQMETLVADPAQKAFLQGLTQVVKELEALQQLFLFRK